jgi:transcriptional regulator with XRE-family HTH domain
VTARLVKLLEQERIRQGISKSALEERMGCGARVWHRISRGHLQRPSAQILEEAAQALGVQFCTVAEGEPGWTELRECVICHRRYEPKKPWQITCGARQCRHARQVQRNRENRK